MTSGQKTNIDRLKKLHVAAKKIRKQHPHYSYADCLKLASKHSIKPKKIASTLLLERNDLLFPSSKKPDKKLLTLRDKKGKYKGYKQIAGKTKKISEKRILNATHKAKSAVNKLDELQHEHMLQKSIGKMTEPFLAIFTTGGKTIIQRFKTTSLVEAKKLASAFKKMHKLKGTTKVSKSSHI